ncbi:MAG: AAA family ATPase [Deltaproteobacteria bacterium]|nr:AAA family ATPase [Deltaproteobacteria bacterium]
MEQKVTPMYLAHYKLKEKPFQKPPDPKYLWRRENHRDILLALDKGILGNNGVTLFTGDVGTGKTTHINAWLAHLGEEAIVANITLPVREELDFLNLVADRFNLNIKFSSKIDFLIQFRRFLNKCYSKNKNVLLIIDDAHKLDQKLLDQIQFVSNIGRHDTKHLKIIFVGQDEFNTLLSEKDNQELRQRITFNYRIEPLMAIDVGDYILHRLRVAGHEGNMFSAGAIGKIFSFSKGYPGVINMICDHALSIGYDKVKKTIDAGIINECADCLGIPTEGMDCFKLEPESAGKINQIEETPAIKPSGRKLTSALLLALALIVFSFFYYHWKFGQGSIDPPKLASMDMPETGRANEKINSIVQDPQKSQETMLPVPVLNSTNNDTSHHGEKDSIGLPKEDNTQKPTSFKIRELTPMGTAKIKDADKKANSVVRGPQKSHETISELQQKKSTVAPLPQAATLLNEEKQTDHNPLTAPHFEKIELNMPKDTIPSAQYTVYLHYTNEKNKKLMEEMGMLLKNEGMGVFGIERVDYRNNDIRYFHKEDKAGALLLQKYSSKFIPPYMNLEDTNIKIIDLSQKYPNAQKGALELWVNF